MQKTEEKTRRDEVQPLLYERKKRRVDEGQKRIPEFNFNAIEFLFQNQKAVDSKFMKKYLNIFSPTYILIYVLLYPNAFNRILLVGQRKITCPSSKPNLLHQVIFDIPACNFNELLKLYF